MTEQQKVWKLLVKRQYEAALEVASDKWKDGVFHMRSTIKELPLIEDLHVPHWRIQPIVGKAPDDIFWYRVSRGMFNVNTRLRSLEQIDYLEERDLFHDTFGHLPIMWDKEYTDYVLALGTTARLHKDNPDAQQALANLYWFTSEFGLVREHDQIRVFGAGILSSADEIDYAMSNESEKRILTHSRFQEIIKRRGYITDGFQDVYYVLPDWDHLPQLISWFWQAFPII